jgi:hypothetical protein
MHRDGVEAVMAESPRNPDPNAPQNPPRSVLNKNVRRSAAWTYLTPLVVFFAGVAVILAYWGTSPPVRRDVEEPRVEGTTGTERDGSGESTPGGHNPDRAIAKPKREVEDRGGRILNELGEVFEDSRDTIGRRVEILDVDVERVDSATLFWIRDGSVRAAVAAPTGATVHAGQSVNVIGAVERTTEGVRIRASRVEPSR